MSQHGGSAYTLRALLEVVTLPSASCTEGSAFACHKPPQAPKHKHTCKLHEVAGSSHNALQASQRTRHFCQIYVSSNSSSGRSEICTLVPDTSICSAGYAAEGPSACRRPALARHSPPPNSSGNPSRTASGLTSTSQAGSPATPVQGSFYSLHRAATQMLPNSRPWAPHAEPLRSACQLATWHQ